MPKADKGAAAGAEREAIIDAALTLAAEKPWHDVSITDIAAAADTDLAAIRRAFRSKHAILQGFIDRIDTAVLAAIDQELANDPPRERLFDLLAERLDLLQPHKAALTSIQRSMRGDPTALAEANMAALQSMRWMLDAAGIGSDGLLGAARAQGLVLVMARTMSVFLNDDDPGLARTLAALDRHLSMAERMARRGDDLCRFAGGVRRFMRGRRRRGDYGYDDGWEEAGGGI